MKALLRPLKISLRPMKAKKQTNKPRKATKEVNLKEVLEQCRVVYNVISIRFMLVCTTCTIHVACVNIEEVFCKKKSRNPTATWRAGKSHSAEAKVFHMDGRPCPETYFFTQTQIWDQKMPDPSPKLTENMPKWNICCCSCWIGALNKPIDKCQISTNRKPTIPLKNT